MIETAECLGLLIEPGKTARVTMTFDEYWLDVTTEYEGKPLVTGVETPGVEDLLADETQLTRLGAIMIRRLATRLTASSSGANQSVILGFEHLRMSRKSGNRFSEKGHAPLEESGLPRSRMGQLPWKTAVFRLS